MKFDGFTENCLKALWYMWRMEQNIYEKGDFMKKLAVVFCVAAIFAAGTVRADDLMDAYHTQYDRMTKGIAFRKSLSERTCAEKPQSLYGCIGSMKRVLDAQRERDSLKLRVLEKYDDLPEWWIE
jgi:hypothetical protein